MNQSFSSSIELVVARFNEPLNWLRRVPNAIRITVYDKNETNERESNERESNAPIDDRTSRVRRETLPNIGRESHTYLHHIVARYETLAPLTVFCQGKPFDHAFDFHHTLRQLAQSELAQSSDDAQAISRIYAQTLTDADVADTQKIVEARDVVDDFGFAPLGHLVDTDSACGERLFTGWSKNDDGRGLDVAGFHRALFGSPESNEYAFRLGAQFIVTSNCIRHRSQAFYERALQLSIDFPDAAHCFERAWPLVFQSPNPDLKWLADRKTASLKPLRRLAVAPTND